MRRRGHAGEVLKKIQDDPLGGKKRTKRPANANQRQRSGVAVATFDDIEVKSWDWLDPKTLIEDPADHLHERQAATDADFFLKQRPDADGVFGNHQAAGDIVVL